MKTDVTFDNDYGTLPLDENLRSIFDLCYAAKSTLKGIITVFISIIKRKNTMP